MTDGEVIQATRWPWRIRRSLARALGDAPRVGGAHGSAGVSIAVRGLVQTLGSQTVLKGIDLDVAPGEFLTLLGASGSGKTTLLMALAGFSFPDQGRILIADEDVTTVQPHRRDVGIVFQSYALFPHMSVGENIAYPLRLRGLRGQELADRVRRVLELVRLPAFETRTVASLSGGQRQRVAVARAVVFRPRVLLMDEPLSALDKPLREAMHVELRRLHAELGLTTVYVTHDQREAMVLSDRIAILNAGRIAQIGTPKDLYERPGSAFVGGFLGDSAILAVEEDAEGLSVQGRRLDRVLSPNGTGPYGLLLRPERLRVVAPGQAPDSRDLVLPTTVSDVIYEGGGYRLQVRLADHTELSVRDVTQSAMIATLTPGQRAEVAVSIADAVLVTLAA